MWPGPDARGLEIHGGDQPGILDHPGDAGRKSRSPGVARLETLHGAGEIRCQAGLVDLEMPQDLLKIGIRDVEKFEEEVFQIHLIVGLGKTKAGGRFQCAPAGAVQFSYQGLEI